MPNSDPEPPSLNCPDYLYIDVMDDTNVTYNVISHANVTSDPGVTLTTSPTAEVVASPRTVGRHPFRVTATDSLGYSRECAFVVDITRKLVAIVIGYKRR